MLLSRGRIATHTVRKVSWIVLFVNEHGFLGWHVKVKGQLEDGVIQLDFDTGKQGRLEVHYNVVEDETLWTTRPVTLRTPHKVSGQVTTVHNALLPSMLDGTGVPIMKAAARMGFKNFKTNHNLLVLFQFLASKLPKEERGKTPSTEVALAVACIKMALKDESPTKDDVAEALLHRNKGDEESVIEDKSNLWSSDAIWDIVTEGLNEDEDEEAKEELKKLQNERDARRRSISSYFYFKHAVGVSAHGNHAGFPLRT